MEVRVTPEQEETIRQAIASGRYQSVEDAVKEALARWTETERERAELIASLEEAEADFEAGRGITVTEENHKTFVEDLIREAHTLRDAGQL
jgi:putative addiction module CopG family antidote